VIFYQFFTGKCHVCAILSILRKKYKSEALRVYVRILHGYHRTTYMGERVSYAERRNLAAVDTVHYLSIIADGMAQNHTKCPWYGNLDEPTKCLTQHIQGVLNHKRYCL
jgi:hypothetical protein